MRVLTLAEQIIAALPERIKRAEGDSLSSSSPPPPTAPLSPLEDALMEQMVRVPHLLLLLIIRTRASRRNLYPNLYLDSKAD